MNAILTSVLALACLVSALPAASAAPTCVTTACVGIDNWSSGGTCVRVWRNGVETAHVCWGPRPTQQGEAACEAYEVSPGGLGETVVCTPEVDTRLLPGVCDANPRIVCVAVREWSRGGECLHVDRNGAWYAYVCEGSRPAGTQHLICEAYEIAPGGNGDQTVVCIP